MADFTHLHVHTQYSLLDGASDIKGLIKESKNLGMNAIAITDHGNMFGVKAFCDTAKKEGIKPIIGCEVYVARHSRCDKTDREDRSGHHLILLAKNKKGYHNLVKLVSKGFLEGFYYKPRIDEELLWEYGDDLIVSTACLAGKVPRAIMNQSEDAAEIIIKKYKERFGEDFYLEMSDHGIPEQKTVNEAMLRLSKKTGVKLLATNDVHFIKAEDAEAHDILVCLSTNKDYNDPNRLRYTGNEYLKSPDEMASLFEFAPDALANTREVADKIEEFDLTRDVILPEYPLPDEFDNQDDYLRHITFEGAQERYGEITEEINSRLDHELTIIKNMGFAGYFLIVQDFLQAARNMDVSVGPGRGSAAGSAVAYCIKITDIDPIKYKLLFERFLNPERVTMPDIDIDFDEDGRERVMQWVVDKYGEDKVAQIITFGTMAAKMSIRDVARVLQLPLPDADRLAKLVPDGPKVKLKNAYEDVAELKETLKGGDLPARTLDLAKTLEGSVRQTGIHACGVIIGRDPLIEHIPLTHAKDADLQVTQYDGKHIEDVGMLKMDFLGLKTLSIIKDAIDNVKLSKGIEIRVEDIPLDDNKTFDLYQQGRTVGTFQFESEGMRKYLRELKPTNIEDLIAMNALYRPGPMEFIPTFIKRKHGLEKVAYPHPMLEHILKDTYGIMVYQEQIMQTAQIMGGFSLGAADLLRRAMGKKKMDIMEKQKVVFVEGAQKQGVAEEKAKEVFDVMTEFAKYGFNRSHSAAYSVVAFHTGYMKANYPGEYMAAVLSRNLSDIKKITTFMDECRRMGVTVLGPDVNESVSKFNVNQDGDVRFGLAAIKGVGGAAVESLIACREKDGPFKDIYDFVERVDLHHVNKRNIEALVLAGAFDSFGIKRSQFFQEENGSSFIETLVRYGNNVQLDNDKQQNSLFGDSAGMAIHKPPIPKAEEWSKLERLNQEKELIGIYLSAHPLDDFKLEIDTACNATLAEFKDIQKLAGRELRVAGIVSNVEHRTTKNGNPFGSLTIEDYTDSYRITMFSRDYLNFKQYFTAGYSLFLTGKVQNRFKNPGDFEFKVSKIQMLSEVKETAIKSLSIKIPLDLLTENLIGEIQEMAENHKGNAMLKFLVYEPETKVWVHMFSRSYKIDVGNGFLDYLKNKQPQLAYKIE